MRFPAFFVFAFAAFAASLSAQAQSGGRDHNGRAERQQPREFRQDEDMQRRQRERTADDPWRHGRLTPEERQQLRRDIREHGRDVYRDLPRR